MKKMNAKKTKKNYSVKERGQSKMKKIAMIAALMILAVSVLTGCGGNVNSNNTQGNKGLPKVGIVQIVEHPSLDTIRENIVAQMAEEGFTDGETVIIDYKNAQNDTNNLKTICQGFVGSEYDMIIAIATPSAQIALGETQEIPIIFSAVTDPIGAELVDSLEKPGGNITGTSDAVSAEKILTMALKVSPNMKKLGALYSTGEVNSASVMKELKEAAKEKNIEIVESTVMNGSEVQQAAQALVGKVDAVFSPIDNTVATSLPVVAEVFNKEKLPYFGAADSMVADGALCTAGVNYGELGKKTGTMAAKVLKGADTATMAVEVSEEADYYINSKTAKAIGITFPKEISDNCTDLAK